MNTPTFDGYALNYVGNSHSPRATKDEATCPHPDDKLMTYTEDGERFAACRACGAMWEMSAAQLWVRCGDADDYHPFDSYQEVVDYLGGEEGGECSPLTPHTQYGFASSEYHGHNYVSLYWGDDDAQPVREITADELTEINRLLENNRGH